MPSHAPAPAGAWPSLSRVSLPLLGQDDEDSLTRVTFRTQLGRRMLGLVYMKMLRDPTAASTSTSVGASGSSGGSGSGSGDVLYSFLCIVDTEAPHADDDIRLLNYIVRAIPS
jgi:hypothetical protein